MPIPAFDHNNVLPPHTGSPVRRADLSPYPCTSLELCQRFATSRERKAILEGFLNFRELARSQGVNSGFQWLDGSFLTDIEALEGRSPRDLDVVTVFWGLSVAAQRGIAASFPAFRDPHLSKTQYSIDHYPFDADYSPSFTVEYARYWIQLFSHSRLNVWKGMLKIDLNTPSDDAAATVFLTTVFP